VTAPQISDYALLGDCHGAALVSRGGSVDWWCAPRFDSPSAFGRLLDPEAGHWEIRPDEPATVQRGYVEDTMVVRTVFTGRGGRVSLTDALALMPGARGHEIGLGSPHTLVRVLEGVEGAIRMRTEWVPRPEYGLVVPEVTETAGGVFRSVGGADHVLLRADVPLAIDGASVRGSFVLGAGGRAAFAARHVAGGADPGDVEVPHPREALAETLAGWRSWSGMHGTYTGRWAARVRRSALVLQALTYQPTGAIVAAPTTSLPEIDGGGDNWDYRFAWLRDASMTLHALWVAACPDEAERNFRWMARAGVGSEHAGGVQIVFGVEGERDLSEHELDHLRGYDSSAPVRVGNDAWRQTQLDVHGEVLASAHLLRDQIGVFEPATVRFLRTLADLTADRWRDADSGIWEGREGTRHYLSSKLMSWVALDRAIALGDRLEPGEERVARWEAEREAARRAILEHGWSEEAGAYSGAFGSDHLDASVLLMPIVGFIDAGDERMAATIDAIERELGHHGLLRRWTGAEDGAFLLCSFWLADCLARAGRIERAIEVYERAHGCANDLGLMSEEVDPDGGALLGNFPQGLSHVGAITAAWSIDRAIEGQGRATAHTITTRES